VGADRRGPLAAFVVIAIIAAVLLVTSVRSQAAPGWLIPGKLPAAVVAGPVTEPHMWGAVTSRVHQVVHDGVVLAHRATTGSRDEGDGTTEVISGSTRVASPPATGDAEESETHQAGQTHPVTTHPHPAGSTHPPAHDVAPPPAAETPETPEAPGTPEPPSDPAVSEPDPTEVPDTHDHGRHLGWDHGHGHDADEPDAQDSEHGHGNGHHDGS